MVQIAGADSLITVAGARDLPAVVAHWTEVARGRLARRSLRAKRRLGERAAADLTNLGVGPSALERLAQAALLHVSLPRPDTEEAELWCALPWELLLDFGLPPSGANRPVVIRHLIASEPAEASFDEPWKRSLFVDWPGFSGRDGEPACAEAQWLGGHLQPDRFAIATAPEIRELRRLAKSVSPGVVHIFDRLAAQSRESAQADTEADHPARPLHEVLQRAMRAICCGEPKPALVVCALPGGSADAARQAVAAGAFAASGCVAGLHEAQRIRLQKHLHQQFRLSGGVPEAAFAAAVAALRRGRAPDTAAHAVLWSSGAVPAQTTPRHYAPAARSLMDRGAREHDKPLTPSEIDPEAALWVNCRPVSEVNYALLHNNRSLFREFQIGIARPGVVGSVSVEVRLDLGAENARYRDEVTFQHSVADLTPLIRIPLVSYAAHTIHERVHTTLSVSVTWEQQRVFHRSFRVSLLPSDEWRDDDAERNWLPSFVFPRDRAVAEIIAAAQTYRCILADSAGAGFAGYHSPDAGSAETRTAVDDQVQSLWWALILNHPLNYINPPPTYTALSQRLRPPAEVLAYGRGTCIDLSLLLAACLEYVDIYPVIFLLKGHAFPGYCRSETSYARLRALFDEPPLTTTVQPAERAYIPGPLEPWVLDRRYFGGIVRLVRNGDLVPIESVWLTRRLGFSEAVGEGAANLRVRDEFDALIDIVGARRHGVTPLPLIKETPQ